jgi:hypothetical protein
MRASLSPPEGEPERHEQEIRGIKHHPEVLPEQILATCRGRAEECEKEAISCLNEIPDRIPGMAEGLENQQGPEKLEIGDRLHLQHPGVDPFSADPPGEDHSLTELLRGCPDESPGSLDPNGSDIGGGIERIADPKTPHPLNGPVADMPVSPS